ncbi:ribbon-helix-helix domain-containing protein [Egibacter rhizosphaerae]|uniref:Ribbon-helix-helix domain-containing protein n=1 Tax=Egibacter rhizosphaerae TaxID=1670831 RepID=A0A411YG87_9ACTN|nr:ribbon-helix-helix domain-containing protein [Egibacter rhizosphaerae]QBI20223.1 ribbon-helix-helix domain-containing protein [Egibacter rhizosphaerae]
MSHRTQITLSDEQYERLRTESERTGTGLAELVRRALDRTYGTTPQRERIEALEASFGAWADHEDDAADYVHELRRGMERRLTVR